MTHPSHTPPHPSSMTSIGGYTTSRTESATGHPHTNPPTGATHHHTASSLPLFLSISHSHCVENTTHNNNKIIPVFRLPDLHLALSELGEMSRSPVTGVVEISNNVSISEKLLSDCEWEVGRVKKLE